MSLFGFDGLYSVMVLIWLLISGATLGLLGRYVYRLNRAGHRLFKKSFTLSFGVGLTLMYGFILVKQVLSYYQTGSVYYLFIALGFFLLTLYMVLQSLNGFSVYDEGIFYNLAFIQWADLLDYQYADKDVNKIFKLRVNKKIGFLPVQEKALIISFKKSEGDNLARVLKQKTRS